MISTLTRALLGPIEAVDLKSCGVAQLFSHPHQVVDGGGGVMRRYVLTGAPGAGKTALVDVLSERGYPVVAEAATDVILQRQARGVARAVGGQ